MVWHGKADLLRILLCLPQMALCILDQAVISTRPCQLFVYVFRANRCSFRVEINRIEVLIQRYMCDYNTWICSSTSSPSSGTRLASANLRPIGVQCKVKMHNRRRPFRRWHLHHFTLLDVSADFEIIEAYLTSSRTLHIGASFKLLRMNGKTNHSSATAVRKASEVTGASSSTNGHTRVRNHSSAASVRSVIHSPGIAIGTR